MDIIQTGHEEARSPAEEDSERSETPSSSSSSSSASLQSSSSSTNSFNVISSEDSEINLTPDSEDKSWVKELEVLRVEVEEYERTQKALSKELILAQTANQTLTANNTTLEKRVKEIEDENQQLLTQKSSSGNNTNYDTGTFVWGKPPRGGQDVLSQKEMEELQRQEYMDAQMNYVDPVDIRSKVELKALYVQAQGLIKTQREKIAELEKQIKLQQRKEELEEQQPTRIFIHSPLDEVTLQIEEENNKLRQSLETLTENFSELKKKHNELIVKYEQLETNMIKMSQHFHVWGEGAISDLREAHSSFGQMAEYAIHEYGLHTDEQLQNMADQAEEHKNMFKQLLKQDETIGKLKARMFRLSAELDQEGKKKNEKYSELTHFVGQLEYLVRATKAHFYHNIKFGLQNEGSLTESQGDIQSSIIRSDNTTLSMTKDDKSLLSLDDVGRTRTQNGEPPNVIYPIHIAELLDRSSELKKDALEQSTEIAKLQAVNESLSRRLELENRQQRKALAEALTRLSPFQDSDTGDLAKKVSVLKSEVNAGKRDLNKFSNQVEDLSKILRFLQADTNLTTITQETEAIRALVWSDIDKRRVELDKVFDSMHNDLNSLKKEIERTDTKRNGLETTIYKLNNMITSEKTIGDSLMDSLMLSRDTLYKTVIESISQIKEKMKNSNIKDHVLLKNNDNEGNEDDLDKTVSLYVDIHGNETMKKELAYLGHGARELRTREDKLEKNIKVLAERVQRELSIARNLPDVLKECLQRIREEAMAKLKHIEAEWYSRVQELKQDYVRLSNELGFVLGTNLGTVKEYKMSKEKEREKRNNISKMFEYVYTRIVSLENKLLAKNSIEGTDVSDIHFIKYTEAKDITSLNIEEFSIILHSQEMLIQLKEEINKISRCLVDQNDAVENVFDRVKDLQELFVENRKLMDSESVEICARMSSMDNVLKVAERETVKQNKSWQGEVARTAKLKIELEKRGKELDKTKASIRKINSKEEKASKKQKNKSNKFSKHQQNQKKYNINKNRNNRPAFLYETSDPSTIDSDLSAGYLSTPKVNSSEHEVIVPSPFSHFNIEEQPSIEHPQPDGFVDNSSDKRLINEASNFENSFLNMPIIDGSPEQL